MASSFRKCVLIITLAALPFFSNGQALPPCACNVGQCTATLKSQPPGGLICGANGTVASPSYLVPACGFYNSPSNCRDACLLNSKCIAYAYDSSTYECDLYNKQIYNMGFTRSKSTKTFYNRNCYTYTCSTPTQSPAFKPGAGFFVGYDDFDPGQVLSSSGVISSGLYYDGGNRASACRDGANCFSMLFDTSGGTLTYQLGPVPVKPNTNYGSTGQTNSDRAINDNYDGFLGVWRIVNADTSEILDAQEFSQYGDLALNVNSKTATNLLFQYEFHSTVGGRAYLDYLRFQSLDSANNSD